MNKLESANYIQSCKKEVLNHLDYSVIILKDKTHLFKYVAINSFPNTTSDEKRKADANKAILAQIYEIIYPYYWNRSEQN